MVNLCPAELFQLYFSSFEAGIAYAISSPNWSKNIYIYIFISNIDFSRLTKHLKKEHFINI